MEFSTLISCVSFDRTEPFVTSRWPWRLSKQPLALCFELIRFPTLCITESNASCQHAAHSLLIRRIVRQENEQISIGARASTVRIDYPCVIGWTSLAIIWCCPSIDHMISYSSNDRVDQFDRLISKWTVETSWSTQLDEWIKSCRLFLIVINQQTCRTCFFSVSSYSRLTSFVITYDHRREIVWHKQEEMFNSHENFD
jgi:hypothetical protein